jgi:AraC-like DNA-binding protein
MIENEFVVSNILISYLDFIEKNNNPELYYGDFNELIKKGGPPTKKLKDFDISKQITSQGMYLHKHTYIEVDYVHRGCCTYYIDNETNAFQLKEKELCIVNQNVVHGIEIQGEDPIVIKCMIPFEYIEIDQFPKLGQEVVVMNFLRHAMNENITKPAYLIFRIEDTEYMEELIYHMFCEFLEKPYGWRRAVKNHLSNLFLYLMRVKEEELVQAVEMEEENLNITKVLDCIRKNYQYITLRDLAKDFHFHENYLSRMIKQHCQMSFRELLCEIRIKEAKKLLMDTELSVTEISARIGYHKPNFFFKLFKDHCGKTPIEFRNECRR